MQTKLHHQQQRVELFSDVMLKIRQSLQVEDILQTTVTAAQQILQADRVLIYHVLPNRTGKTISEVVLPEYPTLMHLEFAEEVLPEHYHQLYAQGRVRAIADVHDPAAGLADCLVEFINQFDIKAKLIVPIVQTLNVHSLGSSPHNSQDDSQHISQGKSKKNSLTHNHLWGLLIAHQCRSTRHWVEFDLRLMQQLANQIGMALSHAQLLEQWEELMNTRTAELTEINHNLQQEINARMHAEAALHRGNEFISVISHELRTPLTSLHSALKLLATGRLGHLSATGQQMLAIADESTERLVRLVNNVLDLQRIESGNLVIERQMCHAATLITHAVESMQATAQQSEITLVTQPDDISIWADPDYILQVLTNLLSNAIKFSSPGGKVWLIVTRCDSSPTLPHASVPEIVFRVRDEGQGIPTDQLERIFERFQQVNAADRKKGGTGLGLSICRTIIEQHGGKIWAESTPGNGSTFTFTLPAQVRAGHTSNQQC